MPNCKFCGKPVTSGVVAHSECFGDGGDYISREDALRHVRFAEFCVAPVDRIKYLIWAFKKSQKAAWYTLEEKDENEI